MELLHWSWGYPLVTWHLTAVWWLTTRYNNHKDFSEKSRKGPYHRHISSNFAFHQHFPMKMAMTLPKKSIFFPSAPAARGAWHCAAFCRSLRSSAAGTAAPGAAAGAGREGGPGGPGSGGEAERAARGLGDVPLPLHKPSSSWGTPICGKTSIFQVWVMYWE